MNKFELDHQKKETREEALIFVDGVLVHQSRSVYSGSRPPVVRVATRDKVSTFRASARIRVDRTVARRNDGLVDVGERR